MLAFKNLLRRKVRTVLSIVGISVGIASIIAFISIVNGFKEDLNVYGKTSGAHLILFTREVADLMFSRVSREELQAIRAIPGVAEVDGTTFFIDMTKPPFLYYFGRDLTGRALHKYQNRLLEGSLIRHENEVMLGRAAARSLRKGFRDEVLLFGKKPFRVVGVYESEVPFENLGCIVANSLIQERLRMPDAYTVAFVYLNDPLNLEGMRRTLEEKFSSLTVVKSEEFSRGFQSQMQYVDVFAWVISLLSVIVGGVGVLNTMMMSVSERVREIGTLRAVGWSRARIVRLIVSEGLVLALAGGLFGLGLGYVGTESILSLIPKFGLQSHYTLKLFLQAMGVAVVLGFAGALYPAVQASRLSPVEALKYE